MKAPPILQYTVEAVTPPVRITLVLAAKFIAALGKRGIKVKFGCKGGKVPFLSFLPDLKDENISTRTVQGDFSGEI